MELLLRGIIDPVDDIRASNPPIPRCSRPSPRVTISFCAIVRVIASSRVPGVDLTNEWNADGDNFSHAHSRRLSAEELMDAVARAHRRHAPFFQTLPDTGAEQLTEPAHRQGTASSIFSTSFESSHECERRGDLSLHRP
jgi:hypothetical protein